MDDNRVDKTSQEKGVANVGLHLTALGNSTGDNGGSGGSEGELEKPADVGIVGINLVTEVVVDSTEEGILVSSVAITVGNGVSNGIKADGTTTGIKDILEHDILHVLGTDRSGTKHGETSLHHEHERSL